MNIRKEVEKQLEAMLPDDFARLAERCVGGKASGEQSRRETEISQVMYSFQHDPDIRRTLCDTFDLPMPEEYAALLAAESADTAKKSAAAAERAVIAGEKAADAAQASATTAREAINLGEHRFIQAVWANAISLGSAFVALVALAVALLK